MHRNLVAAVRGAAVAVGVIMSASSAVAQTFPSRAVTIINPYPPGGGADIVARVVAKELTQEWGQPVIVESRPGGGTTIAAAFVARAPADGHTLLLSTTQHAVAPAVFKSLSYNYLTAFAPIAIISDSPFFLVTRPDRGVANVNDLISELKQKGSSMNFSSSGLGSLPHMSGALLNQLSGANAVHVPYAGTAPALTSVLSGQVDFLFADTSALPNILGGKLKVLATTSPKRSPVLPNVPALNEVLKGFEVTVWTALEAPAGTPRAIVDRIHASVYKALRSPEITKVFAENSRQILTVTPDEFASFKAAEVQKYQKLAQDMGLKPE